MRLLGRRRRTTRSCAWPSGKQPWLRDYLGPEVHDLNRRIKAALDPQNILNPGAGI